MATARSGKDRRNSSSNGKAATATASRCAAKRAPAARTRSGRAAPPGRHAHQGQEAPDALGRQDQAQGHRDLHAPAGHHDEGRRAAAAVVRHRRPRQRQRQRHQAAQRHPHRRRDRHSLSAAFRKYPLYFDNLYCNLVEAGEAGRYPGSAAGPAGGLHGKDRGDQVEDQVGADVPDLGASWSRSSWWR